MMLVIISVMVIITIFTLNMVAEYPKVGWPLTIIIIILMLAFGIWVSSN